MRCVCLCMAGRMPEGCDPHRACRLCCWGRGERERGFASAGVWVLLWPWWMCRGGRCNCTEGRGQQTVLDQGSLRLCVPNVNCRKRGGGGGGRSPVGGAGVCGVWRRPEEWGQLLCVQVITCVGWRGVGDGLSY